MEGICSIIKAEAQKSGKLLYASNQIIFCMRENKMTNPNIPLSVSERQKRYQQNPDNQSKIQQRQKAKRLRYKEQGICRVCCKTQAIKDKSYCITCKDKGQKTRKELRAKCRETGVCESCCVADSLKNTNLSFLLCETCYFKKVARNRLGNQKHWQVLKQKLEAQNYSCAYTGEKITLGVNDSLDHIKPVYHFPELKNDADNVEWVTRIINTFKRDKTPEQFLEFMQHIIQYRKRDLDLT